MPRYLLHVEDNGIIEVVAVPEQKRAIEDVIFEHVFTMYPTAIFCARGDQSETESHWEADGNGEDALLTQWADHLSNAIKAECL